MADFIQTGGSNGGSYARYFSGILSVWENSYDVASNTSNVGYRLQLKSGSSGRFSGLTASYSVNINGTNVNGGSGIYSSQSYNTTQIICEGTTTISHNDDGSKTIGCNAVIDFQNHSYSPGDFTPSGTLTLTTIPRASSVGATSAYIEENTIININRASPNFKHTLLYSFHNLNETIVEKTSNTSINWELPTIFYGQIPNQKSSWATIICITYNGDTEIGRSSCTFTVNTNEEKCKPNISATIIDVNSDTINLTGDNKKLIKYNSTAKITVTANSKNGASINSKKVNNTIIQGDSISIDKVETDTFIVNVTDSRGYSNSITLEPEVINYIPLTINATVKRTQPTTGEVDISFSGNYFNGSFSEVNNTLNIKWFYKENGANEWIEGGTIEPIINNNTYNNGNKVISLGKIFDYQKSYDFYLKVTDKLTELQPIYLIMQGIPIFNWGKDFININGELLVNNSSIKSEIKNYTEEEEKIGVWIDGKPIYRKMVVNNERKTNSTNKLPDLKIDKVISIKSIERRDGVNQVFFNNMYDSSSLKFSVVYIKENNSLDIWTADGMYFYTTIILEYTKTSDL